MFRAAIAPQHLSIHSRHVMLRPFVQNISSTDALSDVSIYAPFPPFFFFSGSHELHVPIRADEQAMCVF